MHARRAIRFCLAAAGGPRRERRRLAPRLSTRMAATRIRVRLNGYEQPYKLIRVDLDCDAMAARAQLIERAHTVRRETPGVPGVTGG